MGKLGGKCSANDCQQNERRERLEGRENVRSVINGSSTWMAASFSEKKLYPEFIEATRDFLNANTQEDSQEKTERERERERISEIGSGAEKLGGNYTHLTFIIVEPSCFAMSLRWSQDALHSLSSFAMFAASSSKSIFEALVTAPI